MVDFGLMLKPSKSNIPVYSLHVTLDEKENDGSRIAGKKILEKALKHASATGNALIPVTRFDINISHGIIYTIKEHNITDILIGLHKNADQQTFFGPTAEKILKSVLDTIYIYKPSQPFNTLKRIITLVPDGAEREPGFMHWFDKLSTIAKASGMPMTFFAGSNTLAALKQVNDNVINGPKMEFSIFSNWDDFLIFSRELKANDLFVIISSRKGNTSYNHHLEKLSYYLSTYFQNNSFMILYPKQLDQNPNMEDILQSDSSPLGSISVEKSQLSRFGTSLKKIFASSTRKA